MKRKVLLSAVIIACLVSIVIVSASEVDEIVLRVAFCAFAFVGGIAFACLQEN